MNDFILHNSDIEKKLAGFLSDYPEIAFAYLFGSQATGKATMKSDVDIAFFFNENQQPDMDQLLQIEDRITSLLKQEIDILVLNNATPVIRMQVLKKGKRIFENVHQSFIRFFIKTVNEYDDLKRVRQVNERNILKGRIYG